MGFILGEMRGIPTSPPPQATWRNSLEIPQTKPLFDAKQCNREQENLYLSQFSTQIKMLLSNVYPV